MDRSGNKTPPVPETVYDPSALNFQSKVILDHAQNTGEYFGKFCSGFASYTRKLAAVRDQGDELARGFAQYSETQAHTSSAKKHLTAFSGYIAAVQDHMHARILRIEAKVVAGFSKYGAMTHVIKDEVEKGCAIRERENRYMEELQRMSVKQSDTVNIAQIRQQTDSAKIAADARKAHDLLLKEADRFEQQKLDDLRRVLMNYCEIELAFHAKVIRLYNHAYNEVKKLDAYNDIENFRNQMHIIQGSCSVAPDPNLILRFEGHNSSSSETEEGEAEDTSLERKVANSNAKKPRSSVFARRNSKPQQSDRNPGFTIPSRQSKSFSFR